MMNEAEKLTQIGAAIREIRYVLFGNGIDGPDANPWLGLAGLGFRNDQNHQCCGDCPACHGDPSFCFSCMIRR